MQLISTLYLAAFSLGYVTAVPLKGIPDAYDLVDITWSVQATRDGPYHDLTGTIEQVRSQLKDINPNFEQEFPPVQVNATEPGAKLEKRDRILCNQANLGNAVISDIQDGISYLRGVKGHPTNGPGPGNCGQVSCSGGSAITWCNDNKTPKTLPSFNNIADSAQLMLNTCPHDNTLGIIYGAQDFHSDNWNGIIGSGSC